MTQDIKTGKKKALVIAVSEYNDKQVPRLEYCKNDGEAMYNALSELDYEFNEKRIGTINGLGPIYKESAEKSRVSYH